MTSGNLYIVATPIGNLNDITFRAIETLKNVDIIACEDTRVTQKLLNHFEIATKTISYHKFSEAERSEKLLCYLQDGKNVALVSDAGTPLISDPGRVIVEKAKNLGIKVIPIPGCNAVATILSAISNDGLFAFCGFFPQKKSEIECYKKHINDFNLIFYESPNRIEKTLQTIRDILGEIKVSIGRELTKIHEEIKSCEISEMINYFRSATVKGEFVIVLHKIKTNNIKEDIDIETMAKKLSQKGYSQKDCAQIISTLYDLPKNEVYKKVVNMAEK